MPPRVPDNRTPGLMRYADLTGKENCEKRRIKSQRDNISDLTYDLLKEELVKRDYVLSKVEKDNGWKGGTLPVPFKAAGASSLSFGELTDSTDVAEDKYVRGQVTTYKELWGRKTCPLTA